MSAPRQVCGCPLPAPGAPRRQCLTIDIHCHVGNPAMEKLVAAHPAKPDDGAFRVRTMGAASADYNANVMLPAAFPKLTQIEERLADMDAMGVDVQVLSPPAAYYYWADRDLAGTIVTMQNEGIAALVAQYPSRLQGLGSIALQHPDLAVEQLRYAVHGLGLKGVQISTSVAGKDLSDPSLEPVWAEAEKLGALIFIHPLGCSLNERLAPSYLSNSIGQPVEHAVALGHIIFSGVLDRYPALKICAAHGGGYLPTYAGRAEHAWHYRPDARTMQHPPSYYLRKIYFDSLVFFPISVRHMIDIAGVSQIVVGTDYPFDMGDYEVHKLIDGVPGLTEDERAAILGGNLVRLLGLDPAQFQRTP